MIIRLLTSLVAQAVKASACNAGDWGSIPGLGRTPGERNGNPLQYSCLEKYHGWRSLVGYSLWGLEDSDMTERLHFQMVIIKQISTTDTQKKGKKPKHNTKDSHQITKEECKRRRKQRTAKQLTKSQ